MSNTSVGESAKVLRKLTENLLQLSDQVIYNRLSPSNFEVVDIFCHHADELTIEVLDLKLRILCSRDELALV